MKKYQIVTYDYIYIIDTKTHQAIYCEHNKKQPKTEKTNRQKVLEFVIQDNMETKQDDDCREWYVNINIQNK